MTLRRCQAIDLACYDFADQESRGESRPEEESVTREARILKRRVDQRNTPVPASTAIAEPILEYSCNHQLQTLQGRSRLWRLILRRMSPKKAPQKILRSSFKNRLAGVSAPVLNLCHRRQCELLAMANQTQGHQTVISGRWPNSSKSLTRKYDGYGWQCL